MQILELSYTEFKLYLLTILKKVRDKNGQFGLRTRKYKARMKWKF